MTEQNRELIGHGKYKLIIDYVWLGKHSSANVIQHYKNKAQITRKPKSIETDTATGA